VSFEFHETMAGSYHLLESPADERPISFTIRARAQVTSLWGFLRNQTMEIEGALDAEGFADHKRLVGTLALHLVRSGTLPYAFSFLGNDGARYAFDGKKTLDIGELADSMSVLPGSILDEAGTEVGRALLRFDLRSDLVRFVRSWRRVG
jgi:hypothetical protein